MSAQSSFYFEYDHILFKRKILKNDDQRSKKICNTNGAQRETQMSEITTLESKDRSLHNKLSLYIKVCTRACANL